jgi:hypothetical protein
MGTRTDALAAGILDVGKGEAEPKGEGVALKVLTVLISVLEEMN